MIEYAPQTLAEAMEEVACEDRYGLFRGRLVYRLGRYIAANPNVGYRRANVIERIREQGREMERLAKSIRSDGLFTPLVIGPKRRHEMPRTRRPKIGPR